MDIWKDHRAAFFLLACALYFAAVNFVNYWPFGLIQTGLVLLMPVLLEQGKSSFGMALGQGIGLGSLVLGFALVLFEHQSIWTWRAAIYLSVHLLWILALGFSAVGRKKPHYMSFFVAGGLLAICLVNSGSVDSSQQLIAWLEALLFVLAMFLYGRVVFEPRKLWVWLACIVGVLVISNSSASSDGVGLADWWRVFQVFAHCLLGVVLLIWVRNEADALLWVAIAVGLAVLAYTTILLIIWFGMSDPAQHDWFYNPPLFAHIRHVGYFMCIGGVVGAWAVLAARGGLRCIAWVVYVLALAVLLWSGGRGALLATLVGGAWLMPMAQPGTHRRIWLWLLLGLLLGFLLSALFPVEQGGMGWVSAWERSEAAKSINALSSSRLDVWSYVLRFVAQRPLLGWGGEGFLAVWDGFPIRQAHNSLLQVLIEWGGVGMLIIYFPLMFLAVQGFRTYLAAGGRDKFTPGLGAALTASLLAFSMVDGIFYYGLPLAFLAVGYAALGAGIMNNEK